MPHARVSLALALLAPLGLVVAAQPISAQPISAQPISAQPISAQPAAAEPAPIELRDGDRVALIGSAFVERLQLDDYWETELTAAFADRALTFRNLGWSGDNVFGHSRAVFGPPSSGFDRLLRDAKTANPTQIWICYGENEAHDGPAGVAAFQTGLERLLDALKPLGARVALLAPRRHEELPPPFPSAAQYNERLEHYRAAARALAEARGLGFLDLDALEPRGADARLTENGRHLGPYGDWRLAASLAAALGGAKAEWRVTLDASGKTLAADNAKVAEAKAADGQGAEGKLTFTVEARRLPRCPPPRFAPRGVEPPVAGVLTITGLPVGQYALLAGEQVVARGSDGAWAAGVPLTQGPAFAQAEALRATIHFKNELFFHRHRPQNETYLFLFRKHEQGNNAVEIPRFDPLIEAEEKRVAELRKPQPLKFVLRPADGL